MDTYFTTTLNYITIHLPHYTSSSSGLVSLILILIVIELVSQNNINIERNNILQFIYQIAHKTSESRFKA